MTTEQMEAMLAVQETYRKMQDVESIELEEGMSHDYVLQSLASKDINAHVKDNKIVVDKTDAAATRSHLKKIGHDHLKVTSKGSGQVAEEVIDEVLDTKKAINAYLDKSAEKRKALSATSSLDNDNRRKINKSFSGTHKAINKLSSTMKKEDLDEAERAEKKKSLVDMLDRMAKKADENTKLQKNRAIKKPSLSQCKEEVEELDEGRIPINHAHDAVGEVLGQSAAVKFATNLKAGTSKHTSWKDINSTLVKQGEQPHHIAKIAAKLKPTQYESFDLDEKELTPTDVKQKEKVVKGMKKNLQSFKDRYGEKAKGVMYATATNIAKKMPDVKEGLEEARKVESMQVFHPSYSSAVQHARAQVEKKGYEISDEDWFHHVNSGPSKPSEGKTNSLHIPLHKDGKPTKKVAHVQVYNRGNDIPNNHELNMYVN